jgi:hypothetical protein
MQKFLAYFFAAKATIVGLSSKSASPPSRLREEQELNSSVTSCDKDFFFLWPAGLIGLSCQENQN